MNPSESELVPIRLLRSMATLTSVRFMIEPLVDMLRDEPRLQDSCTKETARANTRIAVHIRFFSVRNVDSGGYRMYYDLIYIDSAKYNEATLECTQCASKWAALVAQARIWLRIPFFGEFIRSTHHLSTRGLGGIMSRCGVRIMYNHGSIEECYRNLIPKAYLSSIR